MTDAPSKLDLSCYSPLRTRPRSRPATRAWHRAADRFLISTRPAIVPTSIVLGLGAAATANELPSRYAMLPAVLFYGAVGAWCTLNLLRCREAHCLITGAGFDALALAAAAAAILDRNWYDTLSLAIVPILLLAAIFEGIWTIRHGDNELKRSQTPGRLRS